MPSTNPHRRWRALSVAAVLLVTACGADDSTTTESSPPDRDPVTDGAEQPELSPEVAAEQNTPLLETPDNVRDVEVLSVADGSITTLRDAVDGDRPVLLWFWAPH